MIESTPIPLPTSPAEDALAPAPARSRGSRRAIALLKLALTLVVVGFVVRALVGQFRQVDWEQLRVQPGWAALSVLCTVGVFVAQLAVIVALLRAYGHRLSWRGALAAAWLPPLGKYVPGKVASIAGTVYVQRLNNVPAAVALSVAVMLDGLSVIAGLIAATPLLLWGPVRDRMPWAWAWCAALCACGVVALHPRVFGGMTSVLLRKLGRPPLASVPTSRQYVLPVIASFAQWLFAGLALWLMTRSVMDVSPRLIPLLIATAALATTAGYLALFAPGGIGVRELFYLHTLGPIMGPQNAAMVAVVVVAMRLVQTIVELGLAAVGLGALRGMRRDQCSAGP